MNPVIYFDELDKATRLGVRRSSTIAYYRHHPEQPVPRQVFSEVDFDISKCLFIFSYNDESKVNAILKDRNGIKTSGYSCKDKIMIARKHILPKIIEQV
jgi:ATP-dependent Lon protease